MSTKEALRQLRQLFSPSIPSNQSPFPNLTLPPALSSQIDALLSQFAATFPIGGGGGHQRESEGERERSRWREGLLEIWASVEPLPGTESDPAVIARVSSFLVLLEKISAGVEEDDDSALISRKDIGALWWNAILKRTMLGSSKEDANTTSRTEKARPRLNSNQLRPLTVARVALVAATRMIVWAMTPGFNVPDSLADNTTPFGFVVVNEYEERTTTKLRGVDESYGVSNLEECIIGWGGKCPKAFFSHISPLISISSPSHLSFAALLLLFLSRYSAKSYHALKTNLLNSLIRFCLLSKSPAAVSIAVKCLTIFLVTLPVIIGEHLMGIMAVYGRVVSWDRIEEDSRPEGVDVEELKPSIESFQEAPPNPLVLFTVLYGIYPCNFMLFLKDAPAFLASKEWTAVIVIDAVTVRERSDPLIRKHNLHPSLVSNDLASELTDTSRWRRLETADVMAECDRNVAHYYGEVMDPRDIIPAGVAEEGLPGRSRTRTSSYHAATPGSSRFPAASALDFPPTTPFTNFKALSVQNSPARDSSVDPMSLSLQLGMTDSIASLNPSTVASRRTSTIDPFLSHSHSTFLSNTLAHANSTQHPTVSTNAQIVRLETTLAMLQSEVNFQTYLKSLHLAHMGTLHRAKVLDSGAEAERQSLYRTIRALRGQLAAAKTSLEKLRIESASTKSNWIAHIDDLKEKVKSLREGRTIGEEDSRRKEGELEEMRGVVARMKKEAEEMGSQYLDLHNQTTLDSTKLGRVEEYEDRIGALIKTLSICDEDLCKFTEQGREVEVVVAGWKKSELLRESAEADIVRLRTEIQGKDDLIHRLKNKSTEPSIVVTTTTTDGLMTMRKELERLRMKAMQLEEENAELRDAV